MMFSVSFFGTHATDAEKNAQQETITRVGENETSGIIENGFSDEQMPLDGKQLKYTVENGRIKGINGINEVDFVITQEGELLIGNKHHFLRQDQTERIDDLSGHYRPTVSGSMNYPQLFESMGFDLNNTWDGLYDIRTDSSGLVEGVTMSYTKMLGRKE